MDTTATLYDWADGALVVRDDCEIVETELLAADSFLVAEGRVLALGLHRERFAETTREQGFRDAGALAAFWDAGSGCSPATVAGSRASSWCGRAAPCGSASGSAPRRRSAPIWWWRRPRATRASCRT
ncbi:hypothetical protein [Leifsonia sp. P73]|uniref:hypothetical protein n=1 Tax=Leifsonia sp. P73 TaxID=3423959 RepID=UPI003DA5F9E3